LVKTDEKQCPFFMFPSLTAVASSISAPSSVLNGIPWQTKMYSTTPQLHMSQACPYPTPMSNPFKVAHLCLNKKKKQTEPDRTRQNQTKPTEPETVNN
jgi:hypothetical protein